MADIFISYSKEDRNVTEELSKYLEGEGYVVWWDTSLVAGDSYRAVIDKQLDAARAVIVIWSPAAISSDWVIWEAEFGAQQNNLIPLRTADVDPSVISRPFNTRQMSLADDFQGVRAALKGLAVEPLYKEDEHGLSPHDRYWTIIETSEHPEDFESYLKEFPDGAHAALARLTVTRLKRRETGNTPPPAKSGTSSGSTGRSLLAAVMLGLVAAAGAAGGSYAFWQRVFLPESRSAKADLSRAIAQVKAAQSAGSAK